MKFPKFLRIAVTELQGICELGFDSNGKLRLVGGAESVFIQILSNILRFRYKLVQAPDMSWGSPRRDGNWTGLIGMLQRGEADIAICSVVITAERQEVVSFSREYDILPMVFATRKPETLPRVQSVWLPFSTHIWVGVLCLLICMPIMWKYVLKVQDYLGDIYMNVLASSVKLSINIKSGLRWGEYIYLGTWFWSVAILTASYSGVLLSFVTLPLLEDVIRDIPRLIKAVNEGNYKCYAFEGSSSVNSLIVSSSDEMKQLGVTILKNNWIVEPTVENIRNLLKERDVAVIGSSEYFLKEFPNEFTLSKDFFVPVRIGIALRKDFCCKKILDKKLAQMVQAGICQNSVYDSHFGRFVKSNASDKITLEIIKPIKLKDMAGAINIWVIGHAVACVVFAAEMVSGIFKNKQPI